MSTWDTGITWYVNVIEEAAEPPVTLEYVRDQHVKVSSGDAENDKITEAILAATEEAEHYTRRAIMPRTLSLVLDTFPAWIDVPYPPLIEVLAVEYLDGNGETQALDAEVYRVLQRSGPTSKRSRIELAYGQSWPSTLAVGGAVTITYRAGYVIGSPEAANVPSAIKEGIAMYAAELYKQRSNSVLGVTVSSAIASSERLWHRYRVY